MLSMWGWMGLGLAAFATSVLSGVAGFGGALILLPVLVAAFGTHAAVPILTVSVLLGNAARVYFNRGELDLKIAGLFSLGAIPFAVLGSFVYVELPGGWIKKIIGAFLLTSVLYQRLRQPVRLKTARIFLPLGATSGFLSAIIGGVGSFSSPFFLAYGLAKEAFVGTEALCAVGMHLAKSITYNRLSVLGHRDLMTGVALGLVSGLGSYVAKKILERMPREVFHRVVEIMLVIVGLSLLVPAG